MKQPSVRYVWTRLVLRSPLFWLAVSYLLLGIVYAWITPALEKTDEDAHYGYVMYLRQHHTLPPLAVSAGLFYETKQPPLYYATIAALTSWIADDGDSARLTVANPYLNSSAPEHRNDNRNLFLHPPYMTPLILGARLVTWFFGFGTLLATYFTAKQLFPQPSLIPIAAAAIVGFQPNFLYFATAIHNDASIAFLGALLLAVFAYRMQRGSFAGFAALVGALLGLASIAKVSGLVFFPLTGLALLLIHRGIRRTLVYDGTVALLIALLVGGWWYVRNALFFNDPLTLGAHLQAPGSTETPLWDRLWYTLTRIEYTFWANQARVAIRPILLDRILIWWGRIGLGLLVVNLAFKYRSVRDHLPGWILLLSWPITFLILLVGYWNQRFTWPFGHLLFPVIAPIALLLAWGWQSVFPLRWQRPAIVLSAGIIVIISILLPFVSLYPLYHPSREWGATQVEHPVGTIYVEPETRNQVARLIGYNLPRSHASPANYFPIELCWEPLGQTAIPYTMFVQLLDVGQLYDHQTPTVWGRRETYPGLGGRPTDRWTLHQAFCDLVYIWVFPETPTPIGTAIEVGFADPRQSRLQPEDANGDPIDLAIAGRVPILPSQVSIKGQQEMHYTLDNAIGFGQVQSTHLGHSIVLTSTWQSLRPVSYDATIFLHLKNAEGQVVAQVDRQPLDGRFPTSLWLPGQIVTDVVSLPLPPDAARGSLVLTMGMYTWPSMERLPIKNLTGTAAHDLVDNVIVIDIPPTMRSTSGQ